MIFSGIIVPLFKHSLKKLDISRPYPCFLIGHKRKWVEKVSLFIGIASDKIDPMGNLKKLLSLFIIMECFFASQILHSKDFKPEQTKKKRAKEELVVIQTISTDRHTFVISKGVREGILRGQETIFANDNVSILCKAIEVSRHYSLWGPVDPIVIIPFKKDDIVSSNSHAYGNVALDIIGDTNKLELPGQIDIETIKKFRVSNNVSLKGAVNQSLSQSSSDVSTDKNSKRTGYNIAFEYNYRFMPEFEMNFGARYDNEVYRQSSPILDVSTNRIMATMAATYHLIHFSESNRNFYLTIAAGLGHSTTAISDDKSDGLVTLLPEARLGYLLPFTQTMAMIFEGSIESLSSHEKFSSGVEQDTNILNLKLTLGLRF